MFLKLAYDQWPRLQSKTHRKYFLSISNMASDWLAAQPPANQMPVLTFFVN